MKTRRYVFDTNTIVSAFLFENGKPGRALDLAESKGHMLFSVETALELIEVLSRKKFDVYVNPETRRDLLLALFELAELVDVEKQIRKSRDPDDDKFLELAVETKAECIVSGDKDLLVLESVQGVPILTANEFLRNIEDEKG